MAHPPASRVALCGSAPVFENATTWPTLAVIVAGSNSKSLIETATAPASFVSLHVPAAADVAADGATADGAAAEAARRRPAGRAGGQHERQAGDEGAE